MSERRQIEENYVSKYAKLPVKYKSEISKAYNEKFEYGSRRRFDMLMNGSASPTPSEYEFLTTKITEYYNFYTNS